MFFLSFWNVLSLNSKSFHVLSTDAFTYPFPTHVHTPQLNTLDKLRFQASEREGRFPGGQEERWPEHSTPRHVVLACSISIKGRLMTANARSGTPPQTVESIRYCGSGIQHVVFKPSRGPKVLGFLMLLTSHQPPRINRSSSAGYLL